MHRPRPAAARLRHRQARRRRSPSAAAASGEQFLALNGKEYELDARDCVIADESGAIGIGGIIGGESTGVDESTTDVLLECAWFEPERIARDRPALRHRPATPAPRFERGVDPACLDERDRDRRAMIIDIAAAKRRAAIARPAMPTRASARCAMKPLSTFAPDRALARDRSSTRDRQRAIARHASASSTWRRPERWRSPADLAAGHRRRGRSRRGNRAHRRLRPGALDPARPRAGRRAGRPRRARS